MVHLQVQRTIAASPEQVFDWLTDSANLTSAPLFLKVGWGKGFSGPSVGAIREVIVVGAWLREVITAYDAPGAIPTSSFAPFRPPRMMAAPSRSLRQAAEPSSSGLARTPFRPELAAR
jgi:hypothetical protein